MARKKKLISKRTKNSIFYFLGKVMIILAFLYVLLYPVFLCFPNALWILKWFFMIPCLSLLLLEIFLLIIWSKDIKLTLDPVVYNFDYDDCNVFFDKFIENIDDQYFDRYEFLLDDKYEVKYYAEREPGGGTFRHIFAFVFIDEITPKQFRLITKEAYNFFYKNISKTLYISTVIFGKRKPINLEKLHYMADEQIIYISKVEKELYMYAGYYDFNYLFKRKYYNISGKKLIKKKVEYDYFKK